MKTKKANILLFIESNTTGTGKKAFDVAKKLGYKGLLLTNDFSQYNDFEGIEYVICDTNNIKELSATIEYIGIESIVGILSTSEYYIEISAELAKQYGYDINNPTFIKNYRDKALLRTKLSKKKQIKQPKYKIIEKHTDLKNYNDNINFPCIVKPSMDSGSNDVKLCFNTEEVYNHVKVILEKDTNMRNQKMHPKVLIEEYIEGSEYSVEFFVNKEELNLIGITEKTTMGTPFFVEYRHIFPALISQDIKELILKTVSNATDELGYLRGALHAEIKIYKGDCYIIEINPRLAGGMIPELVKESAGIDILEQHILSILNKREIENIHIKSFSGIQFITAPSDGILEQINGIEEIKKLPEFHLASINAKSGANVRKAKNSSDRLGYFILNSNSYKELNDKLNLIIEKINIKVI
ncbi:biotin carboxylase [Cytobacillus horneckiae]|uniref:ATP-grasp domain-containing protein n=1 Tax=Cytobacillus horneckiae TaxID=549687 RepID=UPI000A8C30D5|nr:ATP-grasp domain-containing protein [Cytobacillus horneckiae]MBN6886061.1 ATP-grasp domain-containing protein [Cytobacillus horneckiae]MEC1157426.1 ATP-grasp domain-containing protein [Cytobacillus horneckiae]MED2940874.1 ATP-grasp domain-containing protein [Cytobacillus horneckiae]